MFSNQGRFLKLGLALALLTGFGVYAATADYWRCKDLGDCLANPGGCDGRELVTGPAVIAAHGPEGFSIATSRGPVAFAGHFPEALPGKYADVQATFHAPDRFVATAVHVHLERAVKIWGSLLAAVIVCGLFLRAALRKRF